MGPSDHLYIYALPASGPIGSIIYVIPMLADGPIAIFVDYFRYLRIGPSDYIYIYIYVTCEWAHRVRLYIIYHPDVSGSAHPNICMTFSLWALLYIDYIHDLRMRPS
jgi:hypothetical protein